MPARSGEGGERLDHASLEWGRAERLDRASPEWGKTERLDRASPACMGKGRSVLIVPAAVPILEIQGHPAQTRSLHGP